MTDSRKLLLLRHGKATWLSEFDDFDRPLTTTGEKQSRLVGDWLRAQGIQPNYWLVSAARRTLQTADIVRLRIGQRKPLNRVAEDLYLAEAEYLEQAIRQVPDTVNCLILVGHNPGIGELLLEMAGEQLNQFSLSPELMWPATLAMFDVAGPWSSFKDNSLTLTELIHGKVLAEKQP